MAEGKREYQTRIRAETKREQRDEVRRVWSGRRGVRGCGKSRAKRTAGKRDQ